jgi:hypothetical protein
MKGEERRCRMCYEERERKDRGEILNENEREITRMKEIWKRRERIKKEKEVGDRISMFLIRNPKARRANKAFLLTSSIKTYKGAYLMLRIMSIHFTLFIHYDFLKFCFYYFTSWRSSNNT